MLVTTSQPAHPSPIKLICVVFQKIPPTGDNRQVFVSLGLTYEYLT